MRRLLRTLSIAGTSNQWRLLSMLTPLLLAACAAGGTVAWPGLTAARACPPTPLLVAPPDFVDPNGAFAPGAPAMRQTQANFAGAFRNACARGRLGGWTRFVAQAGQGDRVFLANQELPAAGAWISLGGEAGGERRILLNFAFLSATGQPRVPSGRRLDRTLLCSVYVRGSAEDILECLPS